MAQGSNAMTSHQLFVIIAVSGTVSLVSVIIFAMICVWCYQAKTAYDDDETNSNTHLAVTKRPPQREDLRQLSTHPYDERQNASGLFGTRKLEFERPADKEYVTENVQPTNYSSTSLNRSLGVRGTNSPSTAGASGSPKDAGGGSTSSSPYHRQLTLNSESGASALDYDDVPITEQELALDEKLGQIQFNVSYDFQEMTLSVRIIRAINLPAKDFSGTSDPYVKIMLLPDKKTKLQTNIKRRNLNPRWNELFAFEGYPHSKLMNRTLYMQVLDYDRFSRDDPIGEICLPLNDLDLTIGQTMWRALQPCKGHMGKLGESLISLCYQPTVGRITVVIMKCRDLKSKDINGYSDPYVKIWLMHDGKKVEKKKTATKERDLNPVFNESFVFNVPYERVRQTSLIISVMDYDRLGRNELIGQVVLGSKSGPMEVKHWNEMFAKSRQPVAQWHLLKDFR